MKNSLNNLEPLIIEALIKIDKADNFIYNYDQFSGREHFANYLYETINIKSDDFTHYVYKANMEDTRLEHILYILQFFLLWKLLDDGNRRLLVSLLTTFLEYYNDLYPTKEFYKTETIDDLFYKVRTSIDHFEVLKDFVNKYFSKTKLKSNYLHFTQLINDLSLM